MITLFQTDHMKYKKSLEQQRNEFANLETATEKGRVEIIKSLLVSKTLSVSQISKAVGMDQDVIEKIEASLESSHP